jgi:hypothetical protein
MVVVVMARALETPDRTAKLPPEEQAVVNEFTNVIRRHRHQDPIVLARLASMAFDVSIGAKETRGSKLALAVARGMQARQQLAEAEGGSLSSEETARLLQISKTAVLKRLEAGRLLAWREERLQAARFPRWQFDLEGRVLPGLSDVLECLKEDERLDAWGKILFFLQASAELGDKRPLDLLREGQVTEACQAARVYAE